MFGKQTWKLYEADIAIEAMDSTLKKGSYPYKDGIRVITIGLLCIQDVAVLRSSMSWVVGRLIGDAAEILPSPTKPAFLDFMETSVAIANPTPHQYTRVKSSASSGSYTWSLEAATITSSSSTYTVSIAMTSTNSQSSGIVQLTILPSSSIGLEKIIRYLEEPTWKPLP